MTIVAAVNTDDDAQQVVTEAVSLADAFDDELHVVNVREYSDLKGGAEGDTNVDRRSVQQQVEDNAARLASSVTNDFTPIGLIGKPASEIVSYAESVDASYLVISGRKQSPVGKAMFGSTTQQILLNASCPVVTALRDE